MSKVVVINHVTLEGVMQAPRGDPTRTTATGSSTAGGPQRTLTT